MEKALEEGIRFAENLTPARVEVDRFGHARALVVKARATDESGAAVDREIELPARTLLIAAGTQPNTVLAREDPENFVVDGRYFRAVDENGEPAKPERTPKPDEVRVLISKEPDGRSVSFFGDLHPSYAGNVVKAMASAKQGYPVVSRVLAQRPARSAAQVAELFAQLNDQLRARVERIERLTPRIVEVVVRAPIAAREVRPGSSIAAELRGYARARKDVLTWRAGATARGSTSADGSTCAGWRPRLSV